MKISDIIVESSDVRSKRETEKQDSDTESSVIAHTVKDILNPPKVMQHRAIRDKERYDQYMRNQIRKLDELDADTLASYKKAAGREASKLDKIGFNPDTSAKDAERAIKKANKRYSGITRATKKELKIK